MHAIACGLEAGAQEGDVEPLPLVPATWTTGGSRSCGIAERGQQPHDPVEAQDR